MIFQHALQQVLNGTKTQTRRVVKPGQVARGIGAISYVTAEPTRCIYRVGQTYAVCPGRGKNAVARIEITQIRREDVRCISQADAIAEGFSGRAEFWLVWWKMYDPLNAAELDTYNRPVGRYDAWILDFKLISNQ